MLRSGNSLCDSNGSEFQARVEAERVALDAVAHVEVVDPACAKIEMALTHLGGVGNNWANAERAPEKAVERGLPCAACIAP
jgi:hypothetical protein